SAKWRRASSPRCSAERRWGPSYRSCPAGSGRFSSSPSSRAPRRPYGATAWAGRSRRHPAPPPAGRGAAAAGRGDRVAPTLPAGGGRFRFCVFPRREMRLPPGARAAAVPAPSPPPGGGRPPPAPILLLVTIDTLRADHVGCYGDAQAATPVLDRLAREGARFT